MRNVLVTGGAGFIGSHVCEALLLQNFRVICLDNFDDFYDPRIKHENIRPCLSREGFRLVEADILDRSALDEIFKSEKIDTVIHLAARAGVRPSIENPGIYQRVNVEGTLNVLEVMKGNAVKKLILASSSSVYGNSEKTPHSETDNVDQAISPYAATKKACEVLAYTYYHLYGIATFCLRFFTVYGPRQRPEMAIHSFTRSIANGLPILVYGDGSTLRDYTYIDDIVRGIMQCMDRVRGYEIINLGESETTSLTDLIHHLEHALHKKAILDRRPMQPGDVIRTYADIRKARKLLGYDPQTKVDDGIRRFVAWFREQDSTANVSVS